MNLLKSGLLGIIPVAMYGCAVTSPVGVSDIAPRSAVTHSTAKPTPITDADRSTNPIRVVSYTETKITNSNQTHAVPQSTPFTGGELTADDLVRIVSERNPTLEQMMAAAAVAAARYPQVTSLDDPMFGFQTAPFSAGSPNVNYAARAELTQKIPFFGKRELRGQVALAEASAAIQDIDDARLQLIEAARSAFADYYLAEKSLGVAGENLKLLREFRQNAETRYKNGLAPQQDILQADVELTRLEERFVSQKRARQVARARINTLAHLPTDGPLPPPADLRSSGPLGEAAELRVRALASRPDLKALSERLSADTTALSLAHREYKPDVELLSAYDGFWQDAGGRPLQWQIGARVNIPIRYGRRDGAVAEAQAKIAQRRAELVRLTDQIGLQVQEAYEQVHESMQVVVLYETKALPAADANVREAQSAYVNGKVPFLSLVEAQRSVIAVKDRLNEARAELVRRQATLDRVVGERSNSMPR